MIDDFLRRLTVRRRITGGFLALVLLLVLSLPPVLTNYRFLVSRLQQVTNVEARIDRLLLVASTRIASSRVNLMRYVHDYVPSPYEALDDVDQATQLLEEAQGLITSPEQAASVAAILTALADYRILIGDIEAGRQVGAGPEAARLQFQAYRLGNDIGKRIELVVRDSEGRVTEKNEVVFVESQRRLLSMVVIWSAVTVLGLLMSRMITRSITRPVAELHSGAEAFRQGRLDITVPTAGTDELSLLARTFNQLAAELSELYRDLERRVADRTRELARRSAYLEASAEVGRAATSILDTDDLIHQVVALIQEQFNLYYVGLFLSDEAGEWAVLRAGTGEAGQAMLARGHRIRVGEGMIGWSIAHSQPRVALEAGEDAVWLATPELSETRSEAAVPLRSRGKVLGALTVQDSQPGAFDHDTIAVLQTMSDQVAVALDNARLFTESQGALAAIRRAYGEMSRQAWAELIRTHPEWGYTYAHHSITSSEGSWRPEMLQAVQAGQSVRDHNGKEHKLAVPLKVRGQVVGVLSFEKGEANGVWASEEIGLLETLVDQLGQAMESARLYHDSQRRAARERLTREITDELRRATSAESIVQTAVDSLFRVLGTSRAFGQLEAAPTAQNMGADQRPGFILGPVSSHYERTQTGVTSIGDKALSEVEQAMVQRELIVRADKSDGVDHASLVMPITLRGEVIGALGFQEEHERQWTADEIALVKDVTTQVALAVENVSLFEQTQTALEETFMLYRASRAIGAATTISKLAEVLLDAVAEGRFDRGLVLIRRQDDDKLEVVAGWDQRGHAVEAGAVVDINQVPLNLMIYSDAEQVDVLPNHRALDRASLLQDEFWRRWMSEGEEVTLASVPIQFRGELQGALLIACRSARELEHQLDERSLQPFVTLAAQAAVAIENRRLFEETRRAAEQEALLNEMLSNLATALNVPAMIRTIREPLARLVPFEHITLALVDQEMATLEVYHPISERAENGQAWSKGQIVSLQETLSDQVISTRQTKVFDLTDPDLVGVEVDPLRRADTQTCIIIPLVYGRDVLGSLSLAHSSPNTYTKVDVPLLERVAQLTAVAVEKARLFGQLSKRAVQLQTAAQVSQAATSILNPDQLVEQAVELIRDRFRLYYVGLFMVDERNESAVLRAGTGEAGRIQLERGHQLEIGGESMIGWCVANARPRIALDVGEEAIHFDNPALPETRSELALPLISRGETIGALSVQSTSPAAFSREDVTTLQTMAGQLANAIQNARFVEQTQEALGETEALYVASSELNRAQSYEDVLAILRQHTMVGHGAQNVSLNLFDRPWKDGRMPEWIEVQARWTQLLPDVLNPRYPLSAFPSAAQFLRPDQPILIEDVMGDPRLDDHARALYLDRLGATSTIFVPLVVGGQWIGFVNAIYQEATSFPETEVRRLITISNQAAVAVQGLRQLQEIQARARREALIREITGKIRATTDLDTILQTTVAEVSKALGTSHGAIRLGVEESRGERAQE